MSELTERQKIFLEAIEIVKAEEETFLSPLYATGQPLSSFNERFACRLIVKMLRRAARLPYNEAQDG